jgi:hypothetical protein
LKWAKAVLAVLVWAAELLEDVTRFFFIGSRNRS